MARPGDSAVAARPVYQRPALEGASLAAHKRPRMYPPIVAYEISIERDGPARDLDVRPLRLLIRRALAAEGIADAAVALLFAGDELLLRLNREHRGIEDFTDVLAFPAEEGETAPRDDLREGDGAPGDEEQPPPFLGDIAVSAPAVRRQAEDAGLDFETELQHVVLHGLLHLLGYDHDNAADAVAMREREEAVLGGEIHAAGGGHGTHGG